MKRSIEVECSCLSFNRYKSLLTSNEYPHLLRKNKYDSNAFCANFFINPKKQQQQQQKIGEFVLITAKVACKLWFSSWPPSDICQLAMRMVQKQIDIQRLNAQWNRQTIH